MNLPASFLRSLILCLAQLYEPNLSIVHTYDTGGLSWSRNLIHPGWHCYRLAQTTADG